MAIKNDGNTRLIFRCPFCYRGEGDIRVDADAMRRWQPPSSAEPRHIDIGEVPEQPVIQFRLGDLISSNIPCPHLIALVVDLYEHAKEGIIRATEWSFEMDHPWFDLPGETAEARHDVEMRIFTDDFHGFPPRKTPFRDRLINKTLAKENGRELIASGRAIVALEPERMLDDLLAALRTSSLPTS